MKFLYKIFYELIFISIIFVMITTYFFHASRLIWILFYCLSILFEILVTFVFYKKYKKKYLSFFITAIIFYGHLGIFFQIPFVVYIIVTILFGILFII